MTYDEALADRIRASITDAAGLSEKRMFGGLAFLVNGNLAVSASSRGGLLLRVDPADTQALMQEDGLTPFEMRGRPMNGWVHVSPSAVASDGELQGFVDMGITYARSLPPK